MQTKQLCVLIHIRIKGELGTVKVRKTAKIRNRYNKVPHLTKDTTWESDKKKQLNITYES